MKQNLVKSSIWNKGYIYSTSCIFLLILTWIIISTITNNDLIFPSFVKIIKAIGDILTKMVSLKYILYDFIRIIYSVTISFLVSIVVVFVYIKFRHSYSFLKPLLVFLKTIPVVAVSIFIWLLVGGGQVPIITTILVIVPVIIQALVSAIDNMDRNLVDELRMVNNNHLVSFFQVYLPYLLPYLVMSFFQTFGLGLKVMVTSEYLSQINNSIGKALYNAQSAIQIDVILAWSVIIVCIVVACEQIMKKISKNIDY